jgi:hypothetical protein
MGIFDFFKGKNRESKKNKNKTGQHLLTSSSLDDELQSCIKEFDEAFFMEKYDLPEDAVEILYWYEVVLNRTKGIGSKEWVNQMNISEEELVLQYVWGHADEYEKKHINEDFDYKRIIVLMRILCFGHIYKCLVDFENRLGRLISENKFKDINFKEDIRFRLIHAKASVYGTIKYALMSNIDPKEIKEWFSSFEYDKKLIAGVNPLDKVYKKNIDET